MGNFFCLIPNTKLAFVAISKNAVTFLKKVAIFNDTQQWVESEDDAHNIIGFSEQSKYLVPVTGIREYENKNGKLIKIAVWRDPIKRIESIYKHFFIEREYRQYFHYMGLYYENDFSRFMEFLEFEWEKKYSDAQDEHVRRQSDYYSISDVDHIIPIEKVNDFLLKYNISFIPEKSNETKSSFKIENQKYLEKIKKYYEVDWGIVCNY